MNATDKSSFNSDGGTRIGRDTRADLHKAVDTAAAKVHPMADHLASSAHAGLDRMCDTVNDVSGTLSERGKQLGLSYQRLAETGRGGYVRTSPVVSLLVAVAAGYGLSDYCVDPCEWMRGDSDHRRDGFFRCQSCPNGVKLTAALMAKASALFASSP